MTWETSTGMGSDDCKKWLSIFGTQSACPDCCGGFNSQSLSEYHLLHTATRKGWRGQAGFHCESLDITFISQITRKHKRREGASQRTEQGQGQKRQEDVRHILCREVLALEDNQNNI